MTTDDYTTAARAEAHKFWADTLNDNTVGIRDLGEHIARWARDYLAEQEPTDAEVLAALNADYAVRHPHSEPADTLDDYGDWTVDIMRAALRAARGVRVTEGGAS